MRTKGRELPVVELSTLSAGIGRDSRETVSLPSPSGQTPFLHETSATRGAGSQQQQHQHHQAEQHSVAKTILPPSGRPFSRTATLSLGPTTTTTVVTTTTTTTTTFPSLPIRSPAEEMQMDKERYPLAAVPTPPSLKKFCFQLNGETTSFQESDGEDSETVLQLQVALHNLSKERRFVDSGVFREACSEPSSVNTSPGYSSSPPHKKQRAAALAQNMASTSASRSADYGKATPLSRSSNIDASVQLTPNTGPKTRTSAVTSITEEINGTPISARSSALPSPLLSPTTAAAVGAGLPPPFFRISSHLNEMRRDDLVRRPTLEESAAAMSESGYIPNLTDLPAMLELFDALPAGLQSYLMFQLMRRCSGPTLQFMSNIILPTLKRDFLGGLPLELTYHVMRYLDVVSMCNAARVSKRWRVVADGDAGLWRRRLELDGFQVDGSEEERKTIEAFGLGVPTKKRTARQARPPIVVDIDEEEPDFMSMDESEDHEDAAEMDGYDADVSATAASLVGARSRELRPIALKRGVKSSGKVEDSAGGRTLPVPSGSSHASAWLPAVSSETCQANRPPGSFAGASLESHRDRRSVHTPCINNRIPATVTQMDIDDEEEGTGEEEEQGEVGVKVPKRGNNTSSRMRTSSSQPQTRTVLAPSHDHPYKAMYRRMFNIRRNWRTGKAKHISFPGHSHHVVTCLQFDEDKIISGSDDHCINVYDTATGTLRKRLEGHEGGVWALQYVGNTLVSGSTDRTVRVWDIERGVCTHVFLGHTSTVRCLQIIMPRNDNPIGAPVNIRPSCPLIVTGSRDCTLRVWRLPSPTRDDPYHPPIPPSPVDGVTPNLPRNPFHLHTLVGHTHSVRALSGVGELLVSGSYDCTVRVWNLRTGECIWRLTGHSQKVYSVVLDYERKRCMSGSMDGFVRIWNLENGTSLYQLEGHTSLVGLLDLTPSHLVSAAADHTLRIWSPDTGALQHTLDGHSGAITCFQHDANKVVSGSDGTLKMWDVRTGVFVRDLLTELSGVWQVRFDERRCVAAVQRMNGATAMTWFEVLDYNVEGDSSSGESGRTELEC